MTAPVQEPSQGRTDQGLEFRQRQLFRRPAPPTAAGSSVAMWPMSYNVLNNGAYQYALDGSGSGWSTYARDSTLLSGFYLQNSGGTGKYFYAYVRLGPKGSAWGLDGYYRRALDAGIVTFSWATISENNATGLGYDLDGEGLVAGSIDKASPTFYTGAWSTLDMYGAVDNDRYFANVPMFRIMGDDGAMLTSNSVAGNPYQQFDGGSGIWILKVETTGKNGSSSDYKTRFNDIWLTRYTSDGFPFNAGPGN